MVQHQGLLSPTMVRAEEAPLTVLSHWMGDAVTMPWCTVSCAALFAPGDAKTFKSNSARHHAKSRM